MQLNSDKNILTILPKMNFQIQILRPHQEILTAGPKQDLGVVLLETSPGDSGTPGLEITALNPTRITHH